jgi:predicted membrane-bound spermidine synthase
MREAGIDRSAVSGETWSAVAPGRAAPPDWHDVRVGAILPDPLGAARVSAIVTAGAEAESAPRRWPLPVLCAVFFCSGAAALTFESLWFRQAGLAFGNSVWASALVLSSFMAGLALGSGLSVRFAKRIRRPVLTYAALEATVALTGAPLVWWLPEIGRALDPVLGAAFAEPWLLNALRLGVSFLALLVPASAMGATLPILVRALGERDPNFGSVLGRLYGYNTLGAVLGALASEVCLVAWFGVRGAALAAASIYAAAAVVAIFLQRALGPAAPLATSAGGGAQGGRLGGPALLLLASSFVAGGCLLAFEVVWFRLLLLFVQPNALTFSVLLAVVLSGIGLGGALAGWLLARRPRAYRHAAALACVTGAIAAVLYAAFRAVLEPFGTGYVVGVADLLRLSAALTLPVSLLSGVLFTFTGAALEREVAIGARAAGLLTLANTVGSMLGSLAGAFVLLPLLGVERSFFALSFLYGAVGALLLLANAPALASRRWPFAAAATGLVLALLLFPFGAMRDGYLATVAARFGYPDISSIEAVREGSSETVMILRTEQKIEPAYHRLVTGGFSMASSQVVDRRYMKLFVYWALALRPDADEALLISFGIGQTAKALTDSAGLAHIDVVDIAREVLEMSPVVFPNPSEQPLRDPRVQVIVEDGRYFLETTSRRYDLITSEPPPPKHAGVVNLYTREYFQLIHDRLTEGGVNTYWLPVHQLTLADTQAIIRAYCDAFPNCSLWAGYGYSWMLAGTRGEPAPPSEADFSRQWRDPVVAKELSALGVEQPEQLAALFMRDADGLARLTAGVPPLTDGWPKRLGNKTPPDPQDFEAYRALMDPAEMRREFERSTYAARILPAGIRERAAPYFEYQGMIERAFDLPSWPLEERLVAIHRIQTETKLRSLALWLLGSRGDDARSLGPLKKAEQALAARDFARATSLYSAARDLAPGDREISAKLLYASCMNGDFAGFGYTTDRCARLPRSLTGQPPPLL